MKQKRRINQRWRLSKRALRMRVRRIMGRATRTLNWIGKDHPWPGEYWTHKAAREIIRRSPWMVGIDVVWTIHGFTDEGLKEQFNLRQRIAGWIDSRA